jgi:hypothetical protein
VEIDPGVGAEITAIPGGGYLFTRHGTAIHNQQHPTRAGQSYYVLRADSLVFDPGSGPPTVVPDTSFEQNWPEREGLAFLTAPTFGDNFLERGLDPIDPIGHGYLSSIDMYDGPFGQYGAPGAVVAASATGTIRSKWFTVENADSVMTMLVAGPSDPDCAVSIVERVSPDGAPLQTTVLDTFRGSDDQDFEGRKLDVRAWRGRTIRLEVSDQSTSSWIALDDVRMFTANPTVTPAPPGTTAGHAALTNQPNPFNPRTEVSWVLDEPAEVVLEIFDLRGRRVGRSDLGRRPAGPNSTVLEAGDLPSGTYLLRLRVPGRPDLHRKISLVR